jgi:hypothetical protein
MQQVKQRTHQVSGKVRDKWSYRIKEWFLRFFGDVKIFREQPRWFVLLNFLATALLKFNLLYDPRSYKVKGNDMRRVMKDIRPGDVLVRGFDNYVDGYFIPGFFSHAGLYLGQVDEATIRHYWGLSFAGRTPRSEDYAELDEVIEKAVKGEQMVIHAMKDGIFMEDLLNFCRCDYMAALRFPDQVKRSADVQQPYSENTRIKKAFTAEELEIATQLQSNSPVTFSAVFPVMFKLALSQLGKSYDFGLDFSSFKKMSCTEFVYYCTKSMEWCSNVHPVVESVMGIKAPGIAPDGFAGSTHLEVAFQSDSLMVQQIMPQIRANYPGPYGH